MRAGRSRLPLSVKLLGWTSLFTDAASEAIYPLLPVFVTRVLGGSVISLGIIEGAADAISSLLKVVAGQLSDRTGRRRPFVIAGYAIAGLTRPLISVAASWQHVFAIRVSDRVGKGLRGAPRDAMLAALAPSTERGRVFGFHRAMDHAGAVVGPLVAASFLWFFPEQYRTLFALTIIPGALAVGMLLFVPEVSPKDQKRAPNGASSYEAATPPSPTSAEGASPTSGASPPLPLSLRRFLIILAIFTLGNSTDAFLLLQLSEAGLPTLYLPIVWAGLHAIKAGLSTSGGALSDRFGRRRMIIGGWIVYAIVYAGFALTDALIPLLAWFFAYGIYFALVEGSEKALIADLTPAGIEGRTFGWYNAVLGFGALAASLLFGVLWERFGAPVAFLGGAALALIAATLLAVDSRPASRS